MYMHSFVINKNVKWRRLIWVSLQFSVFISQCDVKSFIKSVVRQVIWKTRRNKTRTDSLRNTKDTKEEFNVA